MATAGIFLPAFFFVAVSGSLVPLRYHFNSAWLVVGGAITGLLLYGRI